MTRDQIVPGPFRYLITETGGPSSFDPLDADATQNLPVARMMYTTPLEISKQDRLESLVLSNFSYDSDSHVITWVVRDGLVFADQTPVTTDDVVLSILRMAARRPKFPVIREIKGVEEWAASEHPLKSLPSGIRVHGNTIKISLTHDVEHPLFRFCLEIFGIIPARCVDREKNVVTCAKPPESGRYTLESSAKERITFSKRSDLNLGRTIPDKISFEYVSPKDLFSNLVIDEKTVVAANESLFLPEELERLTKLYQIQYLPRSRFNGFLLNSETGPFKSAECRLLFATELRKKYADLMGAGIQVEGAISPKIIAGYVSLAQLERDFQVPSEARELCHKILINNPIKWAVIEGSRNAVFEEAVKAVLKNLGQKAVDPIVCLTRSEQDDLFKKAEIGVVRMGSGLWPLDPFGDLQMLFTPRLHKTLEALQDDDALQAMIHDLRVGVSGSEKISKAKQLNSYLYSQAVFNILEHTSRLYISRPNVMADSVPAAITSPAPWQVFALK